MNQIDEKQILDKSAETVLQQGITLTVDILPRNYFHKLFQRWGWMDPNRTLVISAIYMGTLIRVSRLVLQMETSFFDKNNLLESNFKALDKYGELLAECIALCIHNKRAEVPRSLVNFILDNFTTAEMLRVLHLVIRQMDISSFMNTIVSIKGVNILTSPAASAPNVSETSL